MQCQRKLILWHYWRPSCPALRTRPEIHSAGFNLTVLRRQLVGVQDLGQFRREAVQIRHQRARDPNARRIGVIALFLWPVPE
jgi:hypothetical protein